MHGAGEGVLDGSRQRGQRALRVATDDAQAEIVPVDRVVGHKGCPEVAQVGFRNAGEDRAETGDAGDDADEPRRAGKARGNAGALVALSPSRCSAAQRPTRL